jgi:AAA domain
VTLPASFTSRLAVAPLPHCPNRCLSICLSVPSHSACLFGNPALFPCLPSQCPLKRFCHEQAGYAVSMLSEQYRMHAAISAWPSAYFYRRRLIDGPNITARGAR